MLKVSITDENNVETNSGVFPDETQLNIWYNYNIDYFPDPHTKTVTSLVDIKAAQDRILESEEAIDLGTQLIVEIRSINRRKLKTGVWTSTVFNSLLTNATAAQIERALWNGSLTTAAYLLTSMSSFYSDIEIQSIVEKINAHEAKWVNLI